MSVASPRRALGSACLSLTIASFLLAAVPAAAEAQTAPAAPPAAASSTTSPPWTVIASGLANPRGLATGNGNLYVAEAGSAGTYCPAPNQCAGLTGKIEAVRLRSDARWTVASGFISLGDSHGSAFTGINDVAIDRYGRVLGIIGSTTKEIPPAASGPVADAARRQLGRLILVRGLHSWRTLASVGNYDFAWTARHKAQLDPNNPEWPDANPYGVDRVGSAAYVVDAGSNTLDRIDYEGTHVVAWFPNPPAGTHLSDAVPDCVTHMGATVVVGDLSGRVWTFRSGHLHQRQLSGTPIVSIGSCVAVGDDLYVTDIFGGKVLRISSAGRVSVVASGLTNPIGIAVRDGWIYVTNNSLTPAGGQIVRLSARASD